MLIIKALLKEFDSSTYRAVIQPDGSHQAYLAGVETARNIPAAEMAAGRKLVVLLFDEYNPREAVVVGVYG